MFDNTKKSHSKAKSCRMEFTKPLRNVPAIVKDRNKALRLEMARDHPLLVQHSKCHTQAWRANGDISLILSNNLIQRQNLVEWNFLNLEETSLQL